MEAESDDYHKWFITPMAPITTGSFPSAITGGGLASAFGGAPSPWSTTTPAEPEDLNGALVIQRKGQPFPNVKNCTLLYDGMPLEEKIKMVALWLKDNG